MVYAKLSVRQMLVNKDLPNGTLIPDNCCHCSLNLPALRNQRVQRADRRRKGKLTSLQQNQLYPAIYQTLSFSGLWLRTPVISHPENWGLVLFMPVRLPADQDKKYKIYRLKYDFRDTASIIKSTPNHSLCSAET